MDAVTAAERQGAGLSGASIWNDGVGQIFVFILAFLQNVVAVAGLVGPLLGHAELQRQRPPHPNLRKPSRRRLRRSPATDTRTDPCDWTGEAQGEARKPLTM